MEQISRWVNHHQLPKELLVLQDLPTQKEKIHAICSKFCLEVSIPVILLKKVWHIYGNSEWHAGMTNINIRKM
jgi:hypothetical protein